MVKVNERWAVPHYRLMAEECRITHTAVRQPGISHLAEGGYIVSVNSLEVSNDNPCPNELVTITANTSPPDGNIAWNVGPGPNGSFDMENGLPAFSDLGIDSNGEVILPLNVVDAIGDTITLVGSSGENHTITATHGNPATTLSQTIFSNGACLKSASSYLLGRVSFPGSEDASCLREREQCRRIGVGPGCGCDRWLVALRRGLSASWTDKSGHSRGGAHRVRR